MSSLASILLQKKCLVSGSDLIKSTLTHYLEMLGAQFFEGHHQDQIRADQTVVYSTAIKEDNEEFQLAQKLGCRLLHRSDLLNELTQGYEPILITGTHGKTTTTALLAHLLDYAGLEPSYVIGGKAASLPSHGNLGKGKYFILEADESDGSFLKTKPFGGIVTNIESDHLDFWGDFDHLKKAFLGYIEQFKEGSPFLWCYDDPLLREINPIGMSYGFEEGADLRIVALQMKGGESSFSLCYKGQILEDFHLNIPGKHNVLNAAGAIGLAHLLGVSFEESRKHLPNFKAVSRRLEYIKTINGVDFYDDYAHHPTEIMATIEAMKEIAKNRRLIVVFQPHRYSRVEKHLKAFQAVLSTISPLILTPIDGAKEPVILGLNEALASGIRSRECYQIKRENVSPFLSQMISPSDVVVTIGAGDITHVGRSMA